MAKGYLALLLHAHLPYVRHPEYQDALEERWFYDAITQCYLPLLFTMEEMAAAGIPFRFTMSLTPPLAAMLEDPLLLARFAQRLQDLIELGGREIERTAHRPAEQKLARLYHAHLQRCREAFVNRYQADLRQAFFAWQAKGCIEIIASAATHGYLPLLAINPAAVQAQIKIGIDSYRRAAGVAPSGFWLPECGYYPGVDEVLKAQGIRYTCCETHGITRATPRPPHGVYTPVTCPSGLAVFGRDQESSRQVWSSVEGYPGDQAYREYYRDIGHELDLEYLRPYIHRDGIRVDTGFKYYRITGRSGRKELYDPEKAEARAEQHAADFLRKKENQTNVLRTLMARKPIIVAPYDAELFGHWWHEGPRWLKYLFTELAQRPDTVRATTLGAYLDEYPDNPPATPCASSWGKNGFNETWLNPKNDWIYPLLHRAAADLGELIRQFPRPQPLFDRALQQAARELLLAQASDWAFMIHAGTTAAYAEQRLQKHLARFAQLTAMIGERTIDPARLTEFEAHDPIFPDLDYRAFGG